MNNDYEPILAALLTFFQTKLGSTFATYTRRVKMWTQDGLVQPYLGIRHVGSNDEYQQNMSVTTLHVELWIYAPADADVTGPPDATLNALEKAVRNAMAPDQVQTNRFTIGGLVFWFRILGRSDKNPGDNDGQGVLVLPLQITLP